MKIEKLKPSQNPPGGLKPEEVPQFVAIGFDDNEQIPELQWISELSKKIKNSDGSNLSFSFYNNGKYTNALSTWKMLYDEGHEIGDHTFSHPNGHETDWSATPPKCKILLDQKDWEKEIDKNREFLQSGGIDPKDIVGFRTPFLEFTDQTFEGIKTRNYLYDCSVEEGYQSDQDPTNFFWPYTMEDGSPGDVVCAEGVEGRETIGSIPGLWQMPVYLMTVPADDLSEKYNFPKGLRDKVGKEKPYIMKDQWKITGFDWNLWYTDDGREWLESCEVLAILKYNFDLHYTGNRTPFMFGAHIDIYNTPERRECLESFLKYVLDHQDTKVTSIINILNWIRDPQKI